MSTQHRALFARYLRPHIGLLFILLGLLLTSIALQIFSPLVLRRIIDSATSGISIDKLSNLALIYLVMALGTQVVQIVDTYVAEYIGWVTTNELRTDLAMHCLKADLSFHKQHTAGELTERIDKDVAQLSDFFSRFVVVILGNFLVLVGILTVVCVISRWLGLAFVVYVALGACCLIPLQKLVTPHWKAQREISADWTSFLQERLGGREDISSSGAIPYVLSHFYKLNIELMSKSRKAAVMGGIIWSAAGVLFLGSRLLAATGGAALYLHGLATLGTVFLLYNYSQQLVGPALSISDQLQGLQQITASLTRICELLDTPVTEFENGEQYDPVCAPSVEFRNVTFAYDRTNPVLRDVSFFVPAGQVLGLIGRTGSGKTTLMRLLSRIHNFEDGQISFDGSDIRDLRLSDVRRSVGVASQNVQIFHASIRENLTMFDDSVGDAKLYEALETLGLDGWISSLPSGLDTILECGGGTLSAGEAQVFALARVFLRNPRVVILDEPSSRLDLATEQMLKNAIAKLLVGRTAIIIAHRLETIENVDQILILDRGEVLEFGSRNDLYNNHESNFRRLLHSAIEERTV